MTFDGAGSAATRAVLLDVRAVRGHFVFPGRGRVVTNNAASTQPPAELLALYASLGPGPRAARTTSSNPASCA
jgi:hypothetical protein